MLLLSLSIQRPVKAEDSTWTKLRCLMGSMWAWDPEQRYTPIAFILIMLLITAALWRGALDQDLASYRRDWIAHHSESPCLCSRPGERASYPEIS